jgi:hypothetical protein
MKEGEQLRVFGNFAVIDLENRGPPFVWPVHFTCLRRQSFGNLGGEKGEGTMKQMKGIAAALATGIGSGLLASSQLAEPAVGAETRVCRGILDGKLD